MFDRLRNLLQPATQSDDEIDQLDSVINELTAGIASIKKQYQNISSQETELLEQIDDYYRQYQQKIDGAKKSLRSKNELAAESLYQESEILKCQISHYKKITRDIQETKRKLLAQENHFILTRDELSAKRTLGEANVDASQMKAQVSEQLMYLGESGALSKFDELILDAKCKSEAIDEIRHSEHSLEDYLDSDASAKDALEQVVREENEEKMKASQRHHEILIERAFGKYEPTEDPILKSRQADLLENLRQVDTDTEKEDRVNNFFQSSEVTHTQSHNPSTTTKDQEDRVRNFFRDT